MPIFSVTVKRTEVWIDDVTIEAESAAEAQSIIQTALNEEGWDSVFDDDGEYSNCVSTVTEVTEAGGEVQKTPFEKAREFLRSQGYSLYPHPTGEAFDLVASSERYIPLDTRDDVIMFAENLKRIVS